MVQFSTALDKINALFKTPLDEFVVVILFLDLSFWALMTGHLDGNAWALLAGGVFTAWQGGRSFAGRGALKGALGSIAGVVSNMVPRPTAPAAAPPAAPAVGPASDPPNAGA